MAILSTPKGVLTGQRPGIKVGEALPTFGKLSRVERNGTMSRIEKPVPVPDARWRSTAGRCLWRAPRVSQQLDRPDHTKALGDSQVVVTRRTTRTRQSYMACPPINNMVVGVKRLRKKSRSTAWFRCVGKRHQPKLGYSHEINHEILAGITVTVETTPTSPSRGRARPW